MSHGRNDPHPIADMMGWAARKGYWAFSPGGDRQSRRLVHGSPTHLPVAREERRPHRGSRRGLSQQRPRGGLLASERGALVASRGVIDGSLRFDTNHGIPPAGISRVNPLLTRMVRGRVSDFLDVMRAARAEGMEIVVGGHYPAGTHLPIRRCRSRCSVR